MAINKVDYFGKNLIDLTKDTVTAEKLLKGITAHDKAGNPISGTASGPKPEQEKEITITENGDYPITPDLSKVLSKVLAHVNVPTGGGGGGFDPAPFTSVEVKSWIPASDATKYTVDNPKDVVCLEITKVKPGSNKIGGIAKAFIGLSGARNYYDPRNVSDNVWTGGEFSYGGADGLVYGTTAANGNVTFDHTTGVFSIGSGAKFTAGWEYAVIIARMPLR